MSVVTAAAAGAPPRSVRCFERAEPVWGDGRPGDGVEIGDSGPVKDGGGCRGSRATERW